MSHFAGGKTAPLTAFVILLLALYACSAPGRGVVISDLRQNPGAGRVIDNVPFFPQSDYMCGPAALASVMGYYGGNDGISDVARQVYQERLKGTLPIDLAIYAKERGFEVNYYSGGLDDLKEKLSAGVPLILFLNLGFKSYPVGHYITALGYNDNLKVVLAHSGIVKEDVFTYKKLLDAWQKTGFATLHLTPKK
ncbi:peptidase C39 [bacterium]|nr:MAG: peptidase C39 [bacterium]